MGGKWVKNPPLTPPLKKEGNPRKSTPDPSFIPLRHPTSLKLRGTKGYEGQASGGEPKEIHP